MEETHDSQNDRRVPKQSFGSQNFVLQKEITGLHFYELDFSACHLRTLCLFIPLENGRFLYQVINSADLWKDLAEEIIDAHPSLVPLGVKLVSGVIKVKPLAMINGDGTRTEKHAQNVLEDKTDSQGKPCMDCLKEIIDILASMPVIHEFNFHARFVNSHKKIHALHQSHPYVALQSKALYGSYNQTQERSRKVRR